MLSCRAVSSICAYRNGWARVLASEDVPVPPVPAATPALSKGFAVPQRAGIKVLLSCRGTSSSWGSAPRASGRAQPLCHASLSLPASVLPFPSAVFQRSPVKSSTPSDCLGGGGPNLLRLRCARGAKCVCIGARSSPVPKFGILWPRRGYFTPLAPLPLALERKALHRILTAMPKPQSVSSRAEMAFPMPGETEGWWAVTACQENLFGAAAQPPTSLRPVLHHWLRGPTHAHRRDVHVGLEPEAREVRCRLPDNCLPPKPTSEDQKVSQDPSCWGPWWFPQSNSRLRTSNGLPRPVGPAGGQNGNTMEQRKGKQCEKLQKASFFLLCFKKVS